MPDDEDPPVPAAPARRVLLAARRSGEGRYATEPLTIAVDAGGQAIVHVLIRNEDAVVDQYDLSVADLPSTWAPIDPATVRLLPYRTSEEGSEREVEVLFRPPRVPEAEARRWPVRIVAVSRAHATTAASLPLIVEIAPFAALSARVTPERASGRRRGSYDVTVANAGNAAQDVTLTGEDAEAKLRFDFKPVHLTAPVGAPCQSRVRVRPGRRLLFGHPREHSFTVIGHALPAERAPTVRAVAILRQKPWVPLWALAVIGLLLIAAVVAWLLFFNRVEVPRVVGLSGEFRAERVLKASGLELGTVRRRPEPKTKPGTVIGQAVDPGKRVSKGSSIGVEVALGTGRSEVPDVRKALLPVAEQKLADAGFQLGRVEPADLEHPEKATVRSQVPAAGQPKQKGTPVTVYVREAAPPGGAAKLPPKVAGMAAAAAVAALEAAGLAPTTSTEISATVKKGDVIRQAPPASEKLQKGDEVQVVVSAGYPRVAYDDGRDLILADGVTGAVIRRVRGTRAASNTEAAWSGDATSIVFRRGGDSSGQIMRIDARGAGAARAVTRKGTTDGRPAVSPDGKTVAFVRSTTDPARARLCFAPLVSPPGRVRCVNGPPATIGRPTWSPDGASVLALTRDEPEQVEVARFVTETPNSARASSWSFGELVSDAAHGQEKGDVVTSAAVAPTGARRLAVAANWGAPAKSVYRLMIGRLDDSGTLAGAKPLGKALACTVAWRSDGRELLAAVQGGDCTASRPGEIRVIDGKGATVRTLSSAAYSPAWEPLRLER